MRRYVSTGAKVHDGQRRRIGRFGAQVRSACGYLGTVVSTNQAWQSGLPFCARCCPAERRMQLDDQYQDEREAER